MDDAMLSGSGKRRRDRWHRLSFIVMGTGVAALLAAAVLLVLTITGAVDQGRSGPGTATAFGELDRYLTPEPTPTVAGPPPSEAPIARILIPRFEIDAPVTVKGVDADRVMETPNGPEDVAWYDFSARPGFGSNAVFSGHVDYINYGPAVFWNLKDLNEGDEVQVRLEDGTVYRYQVTTREMVPANPPEDKLAQIVGPAARDVVTLITCGGGWNPEIHQYDQRVIVRAERIYEASPGLPAAGPETQ